MSCSEAVSAGLGDNIGLLVLAAATVDPRPQLSARERELITLVTRACLLLGCGATG